jgi:O-antigen/teichoic acid export membrane protein
VSVVIGPRRVAKNSAVLFLAQAYSTLTLFIYIPLLTRYLGKGDYGRYSYAYAFVGLFQVLALLGIHHIFIRETARNKEKAGLYFGSLLVLKVILTVVTMTLILCVAILRGLTSEDLLIVVICAAEMMIRIYVNLNVSVYRAFEKMEYEFLLLFIDRSVGLVGILLVIHLRLGLTAVFVAFLVSAVVRGTVGFWITLVKFVKPRIELDLPLWKYFLAAGIPIGISLGIQRIYERQGTVILEGTRGVAEVGLFAGALRIYNLTNLAASSLIAALFPVFSQLAISAQERLAKMYQTGLKFLLLLSLPICGAIMIWANEIALLVLGPEFVTTSIALRILAPAIPISFLGYLSSSTLRSADHQARDSMIWGSSLVINLSLNLVLTPRYGLVGAASSLLISEAVFCSLSLIVVTRHICPVSMREVFLGPLACGLIAGAIVLALQRFAFPVSLAVGGFVYLTSIYLLGILNAREMTLIRELVITALPRRSRS